MPTPMENHLQVCGTVFPWHELYVPDVDAVIDFYTQALDLGKESMEMGEMGTYHMLTYKGTPFAGVISTNSPEFQVMPAHWSAYLSVEDVDSSIAKVEEHGGTVIVAPMNVPTVGRMALIQDPQGAKLWLFKPNSSQQ